jgi:hypothetical protein
VLKLLAHQASDGEGRFGENVFGRMRIHRICGRLFEISQSWNAVEWSEGVIGRMKCFYLNRSKGSDLSMIDTIPTHCGMGGFAVAAFIPIYRTALPIPPK